MKSKEKTFEEFLEECKVLAKHFDEFIKKHDWTDKEVLAKIQIDYTCFLCDHALDDDQVSAILNDLVEMVKKKRGMK